MGAAAVMRPCGPHFNNWTDIGAAPAGSPNRRRGFERTAVTLRLRGAEKHRRRGRGEGGERKRDALEAVHMAPGYRVMSTSPRRLRGYTIWKWFLVLINPKCVIYLWKEKQQSSVRNHTVLRCTLRSPQPPLPPFISSSPELQSHWNSPTAFAGIRKPSESIRTSMGLKCAAGWICIKVHIHTCC